MQSILSCTALAAVLLATLAPAQGAEHVGVRIHCTGDGGKCPPPPVPPAPPLAPVAPPAPPGMAELPAPPVPPAPPAPPAIPHPPQPPQPRIPAIPAAAHAACAGKAPGSALAWQLDEGEVMRGSCARRDGKMVFRLRSYALER